MPAPFKYDKETRGRAMMMYQKRRKAHPDEPTLHE